MNALKVVPSTAVVGKKYLKLTTNTSSTHQ